MYWWNEPACHVSYQCRDDNSHGILNMVAKLAMLFITSISHLSAATAWYGKIEQKKKIIQEIKSISIKKLNTYL